MYMYVCMCMYNICTYVRDVLIIGSANILVANMLIGNQYNIPVGADINTNYNTYKINV